MPMPSKIFLFCFVIKLKFLTFSKNKIKKITFFTKIAFFNFKENQYYDYEVHDCLFKKQFKEECDENYKCADNLVCDVNVEPTPIR